MSSVKPMSIQEAVNVLTRVIDTTVQRGFYATTKDVIQVDEAFYILKSFIPADALAGKADSVKVVGSLIEN